MRGALPWSRAACFNSEFQIIQTVQVKRRAQQSRDRPPVTLVVLGTCTTRVALPPAHRFPPPVLQIAGEGSAPRAGQSSQRSETMVSHPQVPRLPLPLGWGSGGLKQLCESEQASERGRCPCAGAATSVGDRCTAMRALCGRCGLKF